MSAGKKIYFASDFHLGSYPPENTNARERAIIGWLDQVKQDASHLYLVGDVFDFWFEYRTVVPKGYIRFLGKLAELSDMGIKLIFFKGNHDMWMFDYLEQELGATIISDELIVHDNGKSFFLHHGDGLGAGDRKYKLLKKIFRSPLCQWLFARLHPDFGIGIATRWSKSSRIANNEDEHFLGEDKEWLIAYAKEIEEKSHHDFYIFGHRHLPYDIPCGDCRILNLGEWINYRTYAVWDGARLQLLEWKSPDSPAYNENI